MSRSTRKKVLIRAADVLGDKGKWMPFEEFMQETMRVVPFAVAFRYAEDLRERAWRSRNKDYPESEPVPPRTRGVTDDQIVRIGQRAFVQQVIHQKCFKVAGKKKAKSHRIRLLYVPQPVRMYRRENGLSP